MTYYAGLDVSLRTVNICIVDNEGERVAETKLASDVQDIIAYLDDLNIEIESVGLEAGTLTQYLTYGLQAAGFVVNAILLRIPAREVLSTDSIASTCPCENMTRHASSI